MKGCAITGFGGNESIHYLNNLTLPTLKDHSILVKNHYASINPIDWKIREGYLAGAFEHQFPLILGRDFCGTVVKVGHAVTRYKAGDVVCGYIPFLDGSPGTFAEHVCVPEEYACKVEPEISEINAASLPLVGLTAWQGIFEQIELQTGQHLLVLGGTTSVGNLALQMAKLHRAHLYATASKKHFSYLESLGVERCIDYTTQDLNILSSDSLDAVFDCIGSTSQLESCIDLVKKGGKIVSICLFPCPDDLVKKALQKNIELKSYVLHPNQGNMLQSILDLIRNGSLTLRPIELFSFSEIPLALTKSQSGHAENKMVVKIE